MHAIITFFADNPLLVLFLVISIGWIVGRIQVAGFSFGVAAVLFAGIAAGAIDERLALPKEMSMFGLVLFVYTIGLASGPGFVRQITQRSGVLANIAGLALVAGAAAVTVPLAELVRGSVGGATRAGLFAGAVTNTPALAAVVANPLASGRAALAGGGPAVGYALAYPVGVLVPLIATWWLMRDDRRVRAARRSGDEPMRHRPARLTARVVRENVGTAAVFHAAHPHVVISRVWRDGTFHVPPPEFGFAPGDQVVLVGEPHHLEPAVATLGEHWHDHPEYDRAQLTQRTMFVSSQHVAGKTLGDLDLPRRYGAVASRVRRGDDELAATDDLVLELGDRLKVVAPRDALPAVAARLGDSFRSLHHLDLLSLSVGVSLGLLLGAVSIPLGGGGSLALGSAGGPLVVGLVLGVVNRTGPLVWQLPHGVNHVLRQLGVALFLAVVGTNAGGEFARTITSPNGPLLLAAGAGVTALLTLLAVVVFRVVLRRAPRVSAGMLAALHTQPAVLAYASEQSDDEGEVAIGYATLLPIAMLAKIVAAQLLLR